MAQWIALATHGLWVVGSNPSGSLVMSGRASNHICSGAPKPNQSQKSAIQGFSQGMETLNALKYNLYQYNTSIDNLSV